jgi:hypothetical protein
MERSYNCCVDPNAICSRAATSVVVMVMMVMMVVVMVVVMVMMMVMVILSHCDRLFLNVATAFDLGSQNVLGIRNGIQQLGK